MKRSARGREQPAHHVQVDARHEAAGDLGVADEPGLRARDLRQPEKSDRPARRFEPPPRGAPESLRDLEQRGAARGVVVGAGGLVAQVRRQDDLAGGPIRARDRGADDVEGRRDHFRGDRRAQDDPLSGRQAAAELLGLPFRNHEGEAVVQAVRREVSPADEVPVVAGPRGRLVGKRREKAGRLPLFAGESVDGGKRPVGENDPAGDRLSGVVRRSGSRADVDELGRNVGVLAVVGERDRELGKGSHGPGTRRNLLQPRARPASSRSSSGSARSGSCRPPESARSPHPRGRPRRASPSGTPRPRSNRASPGRGGTGTARAPSPGPRAPSTSAWIAAGTASGQKGIARSCPAAAPATRKSAAAREDFTRENDLRGKHLERDDRAGVLPGHRDLAALVRHVHERDRELVHREGRA